MKYKNLRRTAQIRKFTNDFPRRFLKIILILSAIWFAFFQGIVNSVVGKHVPSNHIEMSYFDTLFSHPLFKFVIFVCFSYIIFRYLNWWFYDRENYLGNVRMTNDREREEFRMKEKNRQN